MARESRVVALESAIESEGVPRPARAGRGRPSFAWLGVAPFFAYTILFLFLPAAQIMVGTFEGNDGGFTLSHVEKLFHDPYLTGFKHSIEVSLVTALLGGILGFLIAYAAIRDGTPRVDRATCSTTFSGVAANFAGIPLAFAFIATLGTIGIRHAVAGEPARHRTRMTTGSRSSATTGVELAYLYFQIPLMILVIAARDRRAPAASGARHRRTSARARFQFWRYVGLPVLLPSLLGAMVLLFGNSFSAYATATR